ncbi:MAG: hypothetical protein N3A69_17350, partial [Leptospiraceae bacterium]|nr:hypothetical protein [Leptospiraceae bacterium]
AFKLLDYGIVFSLNEEDLFEVFAIVPKVKKIGLNLKKKFQTFSNWELFCTYSKTSESYFILFSKF